MTHLKPTKPPIYRISAPHTKLISFPIQAYHIEQNTQNFLFHCKIIPKIPRMCISPTDWIPSHNLQVSSQKGPKRSRVRIHKLARRKQRKEKIDKDMKLKNLKLYMENMSIIEENEKLRKKATLLHQENLALMSEFQNRFSKDESKNTMH